MHDWDVLNCSLHYATYSANINSSHELSSVSNFTVEAYDTIIPPGSTQLQMSNQSSSLVPNASDYGHLFLMNSLSNILAGYVAFHHTGKMQNGMSEVSRTSLIYTKELLYWSIEPSVNFSDQYTPASHSDMMVQVWHQASDPKMYPEDASTSPSFNRSLAATVEELYYNVTLSLLSKEAYLADSGQVQNVTIERWLNTYTYSMQNLLISYGVALLFSLVACLLGCLTIYRCQHSYSYRFSTILQTTRGPLGGFDALLNDQDMSGADPLPCHLASAQLTLSLHDADQMNDGGSEGDLELQEHSTSEQDAILPASENQRRPVGSLSLSLSLHINVSNPSLEELGQLQSASGTNDIECAREQQHESNPGRVSLDIL